MFRLRFFPSFFSLCLEISLSDASEIKASVVKVSLSIGFYVVFPHGNAFLEHLGLSTVFVSRVLPNPLVVIAPVRPSCGRFLDYALRALSCRSGCTGSFGPKQNSDIVRVGKPGRLRGGE